MGHAAAWGDVNADGKVDLFLGTFADRPPAEYAARGADGPMPDALLLGDGATFVDGGTEFEPGRTSAAIVADLDLDGDSDLVVARNVSEGLATPSVVLRNDHGELTPVAESGLDPTSPGRSIGILDVNSDSLPDLLVLEDRFRGGSSRLYRNLGELRFEPLGAQAGWPDDVDGLGVGVGDLNGDRLTDVVVGGSNRVFVGTGSGLREVAGLAAWPTFGDEDDVAGVALGDVDRDGDADVVLGQHFNSTIDEAGQPGREVPVRLYLNETAAAGGDPTLRDVTADAGLVGLPTKAPHVALVDIDNDGWLDLLTSASAANGDRPAVFMSTGVSGGIPRFVAPVDTGSDQYWVAAPTADVDRDGRLDVVLVEWFPALPTRLLLNRTPSGHWIEVSVAATLGGGPGTFVTVYQAGRLGDAAALLGRQEISPTQGYAAGVEPVAHLGLGAHDRVDVVVTPPPPQDPIELRDVAADQHLRVPAGC